MWGETEERWAAWRQICEMESGINGTDLFVQLAYVRKKCSLLACFSTPRHKSNRFALTPQP